MNCEYKEKGIEGFPNYTINTKGEVYSRCKKSLKSFSFDKRGYSVVCLGNKCRQTTKSVHRLVALAFIPNPHNLPQINHIDEDKTNNSVENLEWCSRQHNMVHRKLTKSNNTGEVNIHTEYKNNRGEILSYWSIVVNRNNKTVFRKRLNQTKYTLQDAVEVRNNFFKTHDFDYYEKLIQV